MLLRTQHEQPRQWPIGDSLQSKQQERLANVASAKVEYKKYDSQVRPRLSSFLSNHKADEAVWLQGLDLRTYFLKMRVNLTIRNMVVEHESYLDVRFVVDASAVD